MELICSDINKWIHNGLFFYSRIYQPNVVMEYEKDVFVYIPTGATFEDVQQIL